MATERRNRDDRITGAGDPPPPRPAGRPQHQPQRGPPPPPRSKFEPVDREKTCPLLLRVFTQLEINLHGSTTEVSISHPLNCPHWLVLQPRGRAVRGTITQGRDGGKGGHHTKEDFAIRGKEPKDEVQIYTWKDATLGELTDLVKEVHPEARKREAKLSFAFVYPDRNGIFTVRQVGMTYANANKRNLDETKALAELNFQIGDYLDVAIL
ncbi:Histone deacetylase complex subunit SAP18-like protein [Drosera capensis]